jgi:hypothetical protein
MRGGTPRRSRLVALSLAGLAAALAAFEAPALAERLRLHFEISALARSAREALADRDYKAAARTLDELARSAAGSAEGAEALLLLGKAKLALRDHAGALEAWDRFLERYPDSAYASKVRFLMADAYTAANNFKSAAEIYRERAEFLTGDAYRARLAALYLEIADEAFLGRKLGREGDPLDPPRVVKDFPRALAMYEKARAIGVAEARRAEVAHRIALALVEVGNPAQAAAEWTAFLEQFGSSPLAPAASFGLAKAYLATGRVREARAMFERVERAWGDAPEAPLAVEELGRTFVAAPRSDAETVRKGLGHWARFLKNYPQHPDAPAVAFGIAEAVHAQGDLKGAIAAYEDVIARFPKHDLAAEAQFRIGRAFLQGERYDEARAAWAKFLGAYPSNQRFAEAQRAIVQALFQKAQDLAAKQKWDGAEQAAREFLAQYPIDSLSPRAQLLIADTLYRRGEVKRARDEYALCATKYQQAQEAPIAQLSVAHIEERDLGDLAEAIRQYEALISRFPYSPEAEEARRTIAVMRQKSLAATAARAYASNEPFLFRLETRNIPALTLKAYKLDLLEYFRKEHRIGGVEDLAVEIVAPDKQWQDEVPSYEPYRLYKREVNLPLEEKGAYVLSCEEDEYRAVSLVLRSDISIVVKQSPLHLVVFAKDEVTGRPADGVRVIASDGGGIAAEGVTGRDGVFAKQLDHARSALQVFAYRGKDYAFSEVMPAAETTWGYQTKAYLYTDRPVYRPGQRVFWRGILRKVDGGLYQPSNGEKVEVSVRDARGVVLTQKKMATDEFGAFSGDLVLGDEPPLGTYTVAARYAGTDFQGRFEVEAYKKPEVLVDVDAGAQRALTGDEVKATARISYYFGGPVKNAPVRWSLFVQPYAFDASRYESFAWFFARDEARSRGDVSRARFVARGEAVADKDGKVEIRFETEPGDDDRLYTLQVEAQDPSRRWVAGAANVHVTAKEFYAIVEADKKVYRPGETIRGTVRVVDAAHRPVATAGQVILFRRREIDGRPGEDPLSGTGLDVRGRETTFTLKAEQPGDYRLAFMTKDRRGSEVSAAVPLTIAGEAEDLAKEAKLVAERNVYTRGETANVLVNAPVAPCWALLTFEGEKVLDYKVVELTSRSTTLPIEMKDAYSPNVFIRVSIPAGKRLYESGDEVAVLKFLKLSVAPDRASARPGEKVAWTITATDHAGAPVEAEVSLAVVDAAIYAIRPDETPPIQPFFYDQKRTLAVATRSSYEWHYDGVTAMKPRELLDELARREMEQREAADRAATRERYRDEERELRKAASESAGGERPMPPAPPAAAPAPAREEPAAPGGALGLARGAKTKNALDKADGGQAPVLRVRRTFADTAYWAPSVRTSGGKAVVETTLPDNLTTWRATIRGATRDTLVGSAEAEVVASQKVLVRLETPRFAVQGDTFTAAALVHNDSGGPLDVEESVSLAGSTCFRKPLPPRPARTFHLGHGDAGRSEWSLAPDGFGACVLHDEVRSPVESDAIELSLPVLPYGVRERQAASGAVTGGEASWKFEVPADAVGGTAKLTLVLTPSIATAVLDGIRYLDAFPYDCVEQAVNRFFPAVAARRAIDRLGIPQEQARAALAAEVERGIVRLANLQRPDGGWGWWAEGGSRPETTALALAALEVARDGGFFVDETILYRGRQAAQNLLRRVAADDDARAQLLRALALSRSAPEDELSRALRALDRMSTGAVAALAIACDDQGRRDTAGRAVEAIVARAQAREDGTASWGGARYDDRASWFSGTAETTAWAVSALLRYEPQSALVEKGVRFLLAARTGAYWTSTRETGAVILALGAYLEQRAVSENDYRIDVFIDGKPFASTEVKGGSIDEQRRTLVIGAESLPPGRHDVRIVKTGTGDLHYAVVAEAVRPVEKIGEAGTIVKVERKLVRYLPPQPEGAPGEAGPGYSILEPSARPDWRHEEALHELAAGEKVVRRIAITLREPLDYAIVEDRLPAGLEALTDGAGGPFERYEPRDDRVAFFASRLPAGTHILSYVARAVTPGDFAALPAEAYAMYEPERMGRSSGERLVVKADAVAPREPTPDELYRTALDLVAKRELEKARPLIAKLLGMKLLPEIRDRLLGELLRVELAAGDAQAAVKVFEELKDRNPGAAGRFAREPKDALALAKAYGAIGEHERALGFLRAIVAGEFRLDAEVADTYRGLGREIPAQSYLADLVRRYPDADYAIDGWYQVARRYYDLDRPPTSTRPAPRGSRPKKMYDEAYAALREFVAYHPESPWCDDAQYYAVLAIYNLEQYAIAAGEAEKLARRYPESDYVDDAYFYAVLARFQEKKYDEALKAGERLLAWRRKVNGALSESEFCPQVRHIFAKIYHLKGDIPRAVEYYRMVANRFEDARDALDFFTAKEVRIDEVIAALPGRVEAPVRWRNLGMIKLKLYPVDLLLLFMKEKDLRQVSSVNLTGVAPRHELEARLAGKPFEWNETRLGLPVTEKGAYLAVAKADDLDASALVLLTDIDVRVQRVGDKVRVYAVSRRDGAPVGDAYVTVSDGSRIVGRGRTDARGVFEARGAGEAVSVVAEKDGNYALYRD